MKLSDNQRGVVEKGKITKLEVDVGLGLFYPSAGTNIQIKLEESEMKSIKLVGISTMVKNS